MRTESSRWPALLVLALLAACGGGGGDDTSGVETEQFIAVGLANLDGTILFTMPDASCEIDAVPQDGPGLEVGEFERGGEKFTIYRSFVSFDLSALPRDAAIVSAIVHVHMGSLEGNSLFTGTLGNILMEHVDLGGTLDEPDLTSTALGGGFVGGDASPTPLASDPTLGYKSADITDEVRADVAAGRTVTSLRLSPEVPLPDGENDEDVARFFAFDSNDTENMTRPFLLIEFTTP